MPELQCEWFDACESASVGMAAHPDKGVIPVCKWHADMFRIPLIQPREI